MNDILNFVTEGEKDQKIDLKNITVFIQKRLLLSEMRQINFKADV